MTDRMPRFIKDVLDTGEILALGAAMEKDEHILMMALMGKARRDASNALLRLATIPPTDTESIIWLQNEIRRYSDIIRWMRECKRMAQDQFNELAANDRDAIEEELYGNEPISDY
jgi:hypothetical protein